MSERCQKGSARLRHEIKGALELGIWHAFPESLQDELTVNARDAASFLSGRLYIQAPSMASPFSMNKENDET
jgi:hypothetical protein